MAELGDQDDEGNSGDDGEFGRLMARAAEELWRQLKTDGGLPKVPVEYVMRSVAHLLDEMGRSLFAGGQQHAQVTNAAVEISRHVLRHSPQPPRSSDPGATPS